MRNKRECKLLPHIVEPIYGLKSSSVQMLTWQITEFSIQSVWDKTDGSNVVVAVIDTGCDLNHEDIKDNILQGYNVLDPKKDPNDGNGHGTHVAGTIAALNNNKGVVGVSPKTKVLPIKALDDSGMGSNNNVGAAIVWAVDNGADIITMSLGSDYPSIPIERALIYAESKNVAVFCAAGNSGINHDVNFPARYEQSVSVGAINRNLDLCEFSCTGDSLDFLAPGQDIVSSVPGNNYASMSGTSMATPFAVGCASLYLSYIRKKSGSHIKLPSSKYIEYFKNHTRKLKNTEYGGLRRYEGYGIIQPIME
jgi:subtilisin family serine protease